MKSQIHPESHEAGLRGVYTSVLICAALLALGAAAVLSPSAGFQVLAGGVIGVANLWAIAQGVRALLGGAMDVPWVLAVGTKMLALVGLVCVFIRVAPVSVTALMLGYAALPLGIVFSQFAPKRLENSGV